MVARKRLQEPSTTMVIRFVLIVLLASAAFLAFARESNACSPRYPGSPSDELQSHLRVFAGKVVAIHPIPRGTVYEFRVNTVWKGPLIETVYISRNTQHRRMSTGTDCVTRYMRFIDGQDYLVYGSGHIPSRSGLLEHVHEDIIELGEGQRPIPGTSEPRPAIVDIWRALTFLFAILIVAIVGWVLVLASRVLILERRDSARATKRIIRQARSRNKARLKKSD